MAFNLVEACIGDVEAALARGTVTAVDLAAQCLRRIALFDMRGPTLNAVPLLNEDVFAEAAASDARRAAGKDAGLLEGVPYTVKDSYRVSGQTVAAGSPAFVDLRAKEDAFAVAAIRAAGGVLVGRTNMPPMAYGGMQRGVYGRAESPYGDGGWLTAAWASGSSNGSAAATAASMAVFGMGEETVSSGRSPASNSGLVAYTPSRGVISLRGNWPLYPTCDVVVPHTRSVDDLLRLLDVVTVPDGERAGDFWREQAYVELSEIKPPPGGFQALEASGLVGLRIAVPAMYVGGPAPEGATPVVVSEEVQQLWAQARADLEALGATVVVVPDLPAVTAYEHPELRPEAPQLPDNWQYYERGPLIAQAWDAYLRSCGDPGFARGLAGIDEEQIYPDSLRAAVEKPYVPRSKQLAWGRLHAMVVDADGTAEAYRRAHLPTLEAMRARLLDDHLAAHGCACYAWPCQGDVAPADADVSAASAALAWANGVLYSNGNRALRHLGIPSVTVPMGLMARKHMPVGLTFAGRAYDDVALLGYARAYEAATHHRTPPPRTPALPSDALGLAGQVPPGSRAKAPVLTATASSAPAADDASSLAIHVTGSVEADAPPLITVTINGEDLLADAVSVESTTPGHFSFTASTKVARPRVWHGHEATLVPVVRDKTMVVVLARLDKGYPAGHLCLV